MHLVEAVLVLMGACVVLAVLARFAGLPYAIVLILAGVALYRADQIQQLIPIG